MKPETFAKFKKALRHAAEDSPFYRELYRQKGIEIDDIKTPEDIANYP